MTKSLSQFAPVLDRLGLWSAQKGSLRCTTIRLRDGSLCLYSPVLGLNDVARRSIAGLGNVAYLLAPNHYHNKGLVEYTEAFPEAALVCSERAKPRLEKQTGEVWLTQATAEGTVWVVCDAFKGATGGVGTESTDIELLGTFPTYGIQDKGVYSKFVKAKLNELPPTVIVPCHGALVRSENLATSVMSLLE